MVMRPSERFESLAIAVLLTPPPISRFETLQDGLRATGSEPMLGPSQSEGIGTSKQARMAAVVIYRPT